MCSFIRMCSLIRVFSCRLPVDDSIFGVGDTEYSVLFAVETNQADLLVAAGDKGSDNGVCVYDDY